MSISGCANASHSTSNPGNARFYAPIYRLNSGKDFLGGCTEQSDNARRAALLI